MPNQPNPNATGIADENPHTSHDLDPAETVLGIDIGGANLKYATADGRCLEREFPMWTRSGQLARQLAEDFSAMRPFGRAVVTMTGELADCFDSRQQGVVQIVDSVEQAAAISAIDNVRYYGIDGQFHSCDESKREWSTIAASNWHALASYVGREIAADGLLVDIGSTTTDVILVRGGRIQTPAKTDMERLRDHSLVYIGCRRTPVCSLVDHFVLGQCRIPVMNELFATIDDARLCLGWQTEDPYDRGTADGKPRDRMHAVARLARMIGLDRNEVTDQDVVVWSRSVIDSASSRIAEATSKWIGGDEIPWILSGHGQDLLTGIENGTVVDLRSSLPEGISRVAPAWAVARLATV